MKYIKPMYHGYTVGDFIDVTQCVECKRTAHGRDQHFRACCPDCGGTVIELDTPHKWVPEVRTWELRWGCVPWIVSREPGYWKKKGE